MAALLADPPRALIATDFDGTLAPIVPEPAAARALPAAAAALRRLAGVAGTVAIITGRPAAEAAGFAGVADVPGLLVLGHYGRQRWADGALTAPPPPPGLAAARSRLAAVVAEAGLADAAWVEDKTDALAVHTRRAAHPEQALDRLREPLARLAADTGLTVEPGRMVLELRPPGMDKGQALKQVAADRDAAAIMFCGDDLGDLLAFRAVRDMRASGVPGLAVCSRSAEVAGLENEADLAVDGPAEVAALLAALAEAMGA
jgi:trehalose 6-phosphate phosphatase